jgi:hypothetical protein
LAKAFPLLTLAVDGDIALNAPIMLHVRLAELLHFSQHIHDPDRVTELHAMRIAAKRLRYTLEIFQPYITQGTLRKNFDRQLAATKKIQELIGEIHDRDVHIPLIYSYLDKHEHKTPELRPGLTRLINEECRDRDRIYAEFTSYWDEIHESYVAAMMALLSEIATPVKTIDEPDIPAPIKSASNGKSSSKRARPSAPVMGGK